MKYEEVWEAVDKLARQNGLSPSGLAKKAGLDATTFNKSKRIRPDGKKRWPSLDSINKILEVTNTSFEDFYNFSTSEESVEFRNFIPYTKFSKLKKLNAFKKSSVDTSSWNHLKFPDYSDDLYAVDIDVSDYEPFYRPSSIIAVAKNSEIRRGDRVLVILNDGRTLFKEFTKRTASAVELADIFNQDELDIIKIRDIKIINRIVWASQ